MTKTFTVEIAVLMNGCRYDTKDMFFDVSGKTYKEVADKIFDMEKSLYHKGQHFRISVENNEKNRLSGKCFYYDN